jgi:hypothetical protein
MQAANTGTSRAGLSGNATIGLIIQLGAAIVVAVVVVMLLTPFGAAVSPDSIMYLDIATHIHNGLGVTSTDYALAHAGENRAVPNTTWPPLYPALLALGPTQPGLVPAATWSAILLAATLFFTQRILSRFLSWPLALLAALPLAIAVPMLTIHTYAWSEQLFIAILLGLLLAVQRHLADASRWTITLVALLLVLAFYTRYIGLLFFPLLPLLYLLGGRPRRLLPALLVACIASAIAVAALLAYNLHASGSLTGTARQVANSPVIEQVRSFVSALLPMFWFPGRLMLVGMFAVGAAALAFYLLSARRALEGGPEKQRNETVRFAFGLAAYYVVCVIALRSVVAFDDIDVRLLGVVVPYLWIGCVALMAGFAPGPLRIAPALLATMVVAALAANGYFVLLATRANWKTAGTPWLRTNLTTAYNNYNLPPAANPNRKFMAARTDAGSMLVTDQPQVFEYTTGLKTFALPTEFSAIEIEKLRGFPARSYIVLGADQQAAFEAALRQHGVRAPEVSPAGDVVLLHLPLAVNEGGN